MGVFPAGVRHCGGATAVQHIEDSLCGVGEGGSGRLPAEPHEVWREHDVGMVEERMMHGGFRVEDVESHPTQTTVLQRRVDRVEVDEPAPAAVDEDRARLDVTQQIRPDQVVGRLEERQVCGWERAKLAARLMAPRSRWAL